MAKKTTTNVTHTCSTAQAGMIVFMSLLANYRGLLKGGRAADNIIPFLVGPPGIGKSELVRQVCNIFSACLAMTPEKELYTAEMNPLLLESLTDIDQNAPLSGLMKQVTAWTHNLPAMGSDGFYGWQIPSADRNYMLQTVPDWMRYCALGPSRKDKPFQSDMQVIFLDEFAQADSNLQVLGATVMTSREVQARPMCNHWFFIAAGNGADDNSASQELPSHVASRMMNIHVFPTANDLTTFISSCGRTTSTQEHLKAFPLTDLPDASFLYPTLEAFLLENPTLCYEQDAVVRCNQDSWPSLRAYVKVSSLMYVSDYLINKGLDSNFVRVCLQHAITGLIGNETTMKLMDFYKYGQHVTPMKTILKTPLTAAIPADPQPYMITLLQCAQALCSNEISSGDTKKIYDYILRFREESVMLLIDKVHSAGETAQTRLLMHPGVTKFSEQKSDLGRFSNLDNIRKSLDKRL